MMNRRYLNRLLIAAALTAGPTATWAQQAKRISLGQLEAMFSNIRARTKWNVDGPLLWGYFFLDQNLEKLKQAASELQATDFRVVGLEPVEGKAFFPLACGKGRGPHAGITARPQQRVLPSGGPPVHCVIRRNGRGSSSGVEQMKRADRSAQRRQPIERWALTKARA